MVVVIVRKIQMMTMMGSTTIWMIVQVVYSTGRAFLQQITMAMAVKMMERISMMTMMPSATPQQRTMAVRLVGLALIAAPRV